MVRIGSGFLVVAALVLVSCTQPSPWFEGSFEEALAEAKASGRMVMIDFWAPG